MAKEKLITRTINSRKLTVKVCDLDNYVVTDEEIVVPDNTPERADRLIAWINEHCFATLNKKAINVVKEAITNTTYAMPISQFMALAKPINGEGELTDED